MTAPEHARVHAHTQRTSTHAHTEADIHAPMGPPEERGLLPFPGRVHITQQLPLNSRGRRQSARARASRAAPAARRAACRKPRPPGRGPPGWGSRRLEPLTRAARRRRPPLRRQQPLQLPLALQLALLKAYHLGSHVLCRCGPAGDDAAAAAATATFNCCGGAAIAVAISSKAWLKARGKGRLPSRGRRHASPQRASAWGAVPRAVAQARGPPSQVQGDGAAGLQRRRLHAQLARRRRGASSCTGAAARAAAGPAGSWQQPCRRPVHAHQPHHQAAPRAPPIRCRAAVVPGAILVLCCAVL